MSPFEISAIIVVLTAGIALVGFWLWMLIDCFKHERSNGFDRLMWALVIILLELLGAIIYYFMRYRPRQAGAA